MKTTQAQDFIQGFADAGGISIIAAREYWAMWAGALSSAKREEVERGGYNAGQIEGLRWSKAARLAESTQLPTG